MLPIHRWTAHLRKKKHSKWLNLIWIEPKLAETEKAGWLPVGIIVQKVEITMKLACLQEDLHGSLTVEVGIMWGGAPQFLVAVSLR